MKVLANETKRILAVLLSVAMIFAYVPNNVMAYADEVSGNDTEEAATDGDEIADPELDTVGDVNVTFLSPHATDGPTERNLDFCTENLEILNGYTGNAGSRTKTLLGDSKNDFTFIVSPVDGYKLASAASDIVTVSYKKYDGVDTPSTDEPVEATAAQLGTPVFLSNGSAKITISKDFMLAAMTNGNPETAKSDAARTGDVNIVAKSAETATITYEFVKDGEGVINDILPRYRALGFSDNTSTINLTNVGGSGTAAVQGDTPIKTVVLAAYDEAGKKSDLDGIEDDLDVAASAVAVSDTTGDYFYDSTGKVVTISKKIIKHVYENNKTLKATIQFDDTGVHGISADASVSNYATITLANEKATDTTADADYTFKVAPKGGRSIDKVWYTVGTDTTKVPLKSAAAITETDAKSSMNVTITKAAIEAADGDIVLHASTAEEVKFMAMDEDTADVYSAYTNEATDGFRYDITSAVTYSDGKKNRTATAEPLKVTIRPISGWRVTGVTYYVGNSAASAVEAPEGSSTYSYIIPSAKVVGPVTLQVKAKHDGDSYIVKLGEATTTATVSDAMGNYSSGTTPEVIAITGKRGDNTSNAEYAIKGEEYFFTAVGTGGNVVTNVTYAFGDSPASGDYVKAILVDSTTGLYKTAAVTGVVNIKVTTKPQANIISPNNGRVAVTVKGQSTATPADREIPVASADNDFNFTVEAVPVAGATVKVTEVGYKFIEKATGETWDEAIDVTGIDPVRLDDATVDTDKADNYTIDATEIANALARAASGDAHNAKTKDDVAVALYAKTEVTKTTGYAVVFGGTHKAGDEAEIITDEDQSQKLYMTGNEEFNLETALKIPATASSSTDVTSKTTLTLKGAATAPHTASDYASVASMKVTGKAPGSDFVVAKITDDDTYKDSNLVYTAELPVAVSNRYSDFVANARKKYVLADKTGADEVEIYVAGISGRTENIESITDGNGKTYTFKWAAKDYAEYDKLATKPFNVTKTSGGAAEKMSEQTADSIYVKVLDDTLTSLTFTATITETTTATGAKTEYTKDYTLKVLKNAKYYAVAEVTTGTTDPVFVNDNSGSVELELHGDINSSKVVYEIYEVPEKKKDGTDNSTASTDLDSRDHINALIEDGGIVPVYTKDLSSSDAKVEFSLVDTDAGATQAENTSKYVTLTGTTSPFTVGVRKVTATGQNTGLSLTGTYKEIDVENQIVIGFRVVDALPKIPVELDLSHKPDAKTTNVAKLTTGYINGRANGETKTGVLFNGILQDSYFTLPKQSDLASGYTAGQIIAGWNLKGSINAAGSAIVADTFALPGESVKIDSTAYSYVKATPIWAPKYQVATLYRNIGNLDQLTEAEKADYVLNTNPRVKVGADFAVVPVVLENKQIAKTTAPASGTKKATTAGQIDLNECTVVENATVSLERKSGSEDMLDATALASGRIKLTGAGSGTQEVIKAVYKDSANQTYDSADYTIDFANAPGYIMTFTAAPTKLKVSQESTATIKLTTAADTSTDLNTLSSALGIWKWEPATTSGFVTVTGGTEAATKHTAAIRGAAAGTDKVKVTFTDLDGITATKTSDNVVVSEGAAKIVFTDKNGTTSADTFTLDAATGSNTGKIYVKAVDPKDATKTVAGTFTAAAVGTSGTNYVVSSVARSGGADLATLTVTAGTLVGEQDVKVTFKANEDDVDYSTTAKVKTYIPVGFITDKYYKVPTTAGEVAAATKIFNGTTELTDDALTLKVYKEDLKTVTDPTDGKKYYYYDVDLSGYTATIENTPALGFDGWYSVKNSITTHAKLDKGLLTTKDPTPANNVAEADLKDFGTAAELYTVGARFNEAEVSAEVDKNSIELSEEDPYKVVNVDVTPAETAAKVTVESDLLQMFTLADLQATPNYSYKDDLIKTPFAGATPITKNGTASTYVTNPDGTKTRTDKFLIGRTAGATATAGTTKIRVTNGKTGDDKVVYKEIPVVITGYNAELKMYYDLTTKSDVNSEGYVVNSTRKVDGEVFYFGEDGKRITDGVYKGETAGWVLILKGERVDAKNSGYHTIAGKTYYVKADGLVAHGERVPIEGKNYLFREDGTKVFHNDTDVVGGKIKVADTGYVIADDDTAEADHTEHKWTYDSMDWTAYNFSTQSGTVTAKFTCEVGKEEGTAPATVKVENKAVKGTETELGYSVFKFTATADKDPSGAAASKATETVYKQFKGGAWQNATEDDWKKAGGSGETGESENPGQTESEPAQSDVASYQSFNLFYADQREAIPVPGLSEALSNAGDGATIGAKASVYYDVDGDAVKVKSSVTAAKDIKKAATAANSLISVGNGEFVYQLPVYYQKPTLSLSSKKGTRKKNDSAEYTFKTQILEKKSSTNPEPIALEDGDVTADSKLAQGIKTTDGITIEGTTVYLVSTAKASGKLVVDPKDGDAKKWAEPISLSYSIGENSKDVIEVSATNVLMNTNAATVDGAEAQAVTVKLNGQSISDLPAGTTVNVDLSKIKDSGVEVGGVDENGVVTDEAVTFGYTSGIKKGNYKVAFSAGTAKTTVTVKVANKDIANKAVTYTVKTKLDVTKKQKMVLVPKLNTVGGTIGSDVTVDNEKYVAQYYADSNKIVVGPATDDAEGWAALGGKGNFEQNITLNVGGIDCTTKVKTTITAGKPTVKIANVTFKKASFPGTDEAPLSGETNVLATYKQGGKTFGLEPETDKDGNALVTFTNGGTADDEGWFKDSKTNVKVRYDAESGKILVQTTKDSKAGSVKVEIKYAGQDKVMKKSFSIKTVK